MKKILKFMAVMLFIPIITLAEEQNYYTNDNGFSFNEETYELIYSKYGQTGIDSVTNENYNNIITFAKGEEVVITKYYATTYVKDITGKITQTSDREITEEEYQDSLIMPLATICDSDQGEGWCIKTDYKQLQIFVNGTARNIRVTNTWLTMPKVRSFDVIAVRFNDTVNITNTTGTQTWSTGSQNYSYNGTNMKRTNKGVGISMNLYDGDTTKLENEMIVTTDNTTTEWWSMRIFITYQHAQSTLTLAQSKSYSFAGGTGSLGNTIKFSDSTISAKYDNMTGLQYN